MSRLPSDDDDPSDVTSCCCDAVNDVIDVLAGVWMSVDLTKIHNLVIYSGYKT